MQKQASLGTITKQNRLFLFVNKIGIDTVQIWYYIYRNAYRQKGLFPQKDTLKLIKAVLELSFFLSIEMTIEIADGKGKPEKIRKVRKCERKIKDLHWWN